MHNYINPVRSRKPYCLASSTFTRPFPPILNCIPQRAKKKKVTKSRSRAICIFESPKCALCITCRVMALHFPCVYPHLAHVVVRHIDTKYVQTASYQYCSNVPFFLNSLTQVFHVFHNSFSILIPRTNPDHFVTLVV
jgi:hypothetical protein